VPLSEWNSLGKICAEEVLNKGGKKLMESIKAEMKK
jgi:hypothetical protein